MTSQPAAAGVREGDVLAGKYRVDRVLGAGGMGVVVAAHHLQLDEQVAIKFLLPETLGSPEAVSRFAREARAAVKIKSEHVARVLDVGTLETGAPYMVMEYLEGGDLSDRLEKQGPLPVEAAVDFLLQACEAIAEAHAIGIVHRDLKPANLFVAKLPGGVESVKVLDFGISKLTGLSASGGQSSATKTSALMGSPLYMSPEQMQSAKDVDARGDVWALGVILYELVTGASPFIAETMPELVLKIMSSEPQPLRDKLPGAPEGLEAVVLKCLEKDRGRRYQTVGELAVALLPFGSKRARGSAERISRVMHGAGMSATAMAPASSEAPAVSQSAVPGAATAAAFGGTVPGERRGPSAVALAAAAAVLVVLGGVAVFALRGGDSAAAAASEEAAELAGSAVAASAAPAAVELAEPEPEVTPVAEVEDEAAPAEPEPEPPEAPVAAAPARPRPARVAPAPPPPKKVEPRPVATPSPAPKAEPRPAATAAPKKASPASLIDERH